MQDNKARENDSKIGISISEPDDDQMQKKGFADIHLTDFFVELCRYLIASGYDIVYGGDLRSRKHSYTRILFKLLKEYHNPEARETNRIINYLAWPYYQQLDENEDDEDYEISLRDYAQFIKIDPPKYLDINLDKRVDIEEKNEGLTRAEKEALGPTLTKMRYEMIQNSNIRILMGGRTKIFEGRIQGIIEEAYIALKEKVPVFLVGMFGGAAYSVIEQLLSNLSSEKGPTMEENDDLIFKSDVKDDKLKNIKAYFDKITFDSLNNNLTDDENRKLFTSDDFNQVIALILKGIRSCLKGSFSDN